MAGAKALSDGLGQASQQAQQVAASTKQVADGTAAAATAVTNAANSAKALPTSAATVATSAQNISALGSTISTGAKTIDTGLANVQQQLTSQGDVDIANTISNLRQQFAGTVTKPAGDVATASAALGTQARQLGDRRAGDHHQPDGSQRPIDRTLQHCQDLRRRCRRAVQAADRDPAPAVAGASSTGCRPRRAKCRRCRRNSGMPSQRCSRSRCRSSITVTTRCSPWARDSPCCSSHGALRRRHGHLLLMQAINRRLLATGFASWRAVASRWVPAVAWAMAQVIVLLLVLLGLGVRAVTWGPTLGIMILTGVCFVSMAQFVRAALGGGGQFVLMGLLALQLTATAGPTPYRPSTASSRPCTPSCR